MGEEDGTAANLLANGEQSDAILGAIGVVLGIWGPVCTLAIEHDRFAHDALRSEVELEHESAIFLAKLHKSEGLGWTDKNCLKTSMLAIFDGYLDRRSARSKGYGGMA